MSKEVAKLDSCGVKTPFYKEERTIHDDQLWAKKIYSYSDTIGWIIQEDFEYSPYGGKDGNGYVAGHTKYDNKGKVISKKEVEWCYELEDYVTIFELDTDYPSLQTGQLFEDSLVTSYFEIGEQGRMFLVSKTVSYFNRFEGEFRIEYDENGQIMYQYGTKYEVQRDQPYIGYTTNLLYEFIDDRWELMGRYIRTGLDEKNQPIKGKYAFFSEEAYNPSTDSFEFIRSLENIWRYGDECKVITKYNGTPAGQEDIQYYKMDDQMHVIARYFVNQDDSFYKLSF